MTTPSDPVTADEARIVLQRLAVNPLGTHEDATEAMVRLAHTVIAQDAEIVGLRLALLDTLPKGGVYHSDVVPAEVHENGWQWRPIDSDTAFAPPFGTIRACRVCGCLVAGGPTACGRCAGQGDRR